MSGTPNRSSTQSDDSLLVAAQAEVDNSRRLRHNAASELPIWSPQREIAASPPSAGRSPEFVSQSAPGIVRVHQESLEDAVARARSLTGEISVLKRALEDAESSRRHTQSMLEAECKRRQESEAHLQQLRQKAEGYVASLESTEHRNRCLSNSVQQLTSELQLSCSDRVKSEAVISTLRGENSQVSSRVEELTSRNNILEHRLKETTTKCDTAVEQCIHWRHKYEAMDADRADITKVHTAEVELLKAQHAAECASMQVTIDALHAQLQESMIDIERARAMESGELTSVCDRLVKTERALEIANAEIDRLSESLSAAKRSSSEERHARDSELEKARQDALCYSNTCDDLRQALEGSNSAKANAEQQLLELRDVNHILAVRLKSATVERETLEMEREARRLLVRQSEEMERQLVELRRTIQSLMGGSASRESHSIARSIARGTHPLGSPN